MAGWGSGAIGWGSGGQLGGGGQSATPATGGSVPAEPLAPSLAQITGPQLVVAPEGAVSVPTQWTGPQTTVAPISPLAPAGGLATQGSGGQTSVAPVGPTTAPLERSQGTGTHAIVAPRGTAIASPSASGHGTGAHAPGHGGEHVATVREITDRLTRVRSEWRRVWRPRWWRE
jgi:hypothetical protein